MNSKIFAIKMFAIRSRSFLLRSSVTPLACRSSTSVPKPTPRELKPKTVETRPDSNEIAHHRPTLSEDEIQKIVNTGHLNIVTKYRAKKPEREALLQNFMIGKVDRELLYYPQVMTTKDVQAMEHVIDAHNQYFANEVKTTEELATAHDIPLKMLSGFRRLKLFGANVPQQFGGLGNFTSEMSWLSESQAIDLKSFYVLGAHRLAVEAITNNGTEAQHIEFLGRMANGEAIGTVCLHNPLRPSESITVTQNVTPTGEDYILNGSKSFIVSSRHANLLVVVAKKSGEFIERIENEDDINLTFNEEDNSNKDIDSDNYLTFVLDMNVNGITISRNEPAAGLSSVPFATINFNNVRLNKDRILSESTDGRSVTDLLIGDSRLQSSIANMVLAKEMLKHFVKYVSNAQCFSQKIRDFLHVQYDLGKIATDIYALHSMIYMTTGFVDEYDNPKVVLEATVTKAFSQDILFRCVQTAIRLVGMQATTSAHPLHQNIQDALKIQNSNESSKALKEYAAFVGLQHSADYFGDKVGLYEDSFLVKWQITSPSVEYVKNSIELSDYLHPSLMDMSNALEESIIRVKMAGEMLLHRYSAEAIERRWDVNFIGEALMYNYAMFAAAGRSSRAYCNGMRYSAHETVAAAALIDPTSRWIANKVLEIKHDSTTPSDELNQISDLAVEKCKSGVPSFSFDRKSNE